MTIIRYPVIFAGLAGASLIAGDAYAAAKTTPGPASAATRGKAVFQTKCATCHGQGAGDDGSPRLPGTDALQRKYGGDLPGALEKRTDLDGAMIRMFVRNGSGAMPMFRKVELSDAEIEDIAAYLRVSSRK